MNLFLLQVVDTAHRLVDSTQAALTTGGSSAHMNLFDLLYNGGVIMIPLALLFVLAVFFFFERVIPKYFIIKSKPSGDEKGRPK